MKKKKTGRTVKEKSARIPETRVTVWEQIVPKYIEEIKKQNTESAKSQRFTLLLKDLFGEQPDFIEEYISGIETYVKVKQKDRILRGEIDNLYGNLVIEFERDLRKKQKEAEEQLQRYVAYLWSQEKSQKRPPYICIATDGIYFHIYSPTIAVLNKKDIQPDEVQLNLVEKMNLSSLTSQDVYFWLDRYFFREKELTPTTKNIINDFGIKSHGFNTTQNLLLSLWSQLKEKEEFNVVYEGWEKYLRIVYGSSVAEDELFCRHTYLSILAKLLIWCRLSEGSLNESQIISVLDGQFFKQKGIENFMEEDFFSWVVRKEAKESGIEIARKLLSLLRKYNLRELSEDVLKSLYQELVDPKTRHDLGEFYTPDWLAHKMVQKLIEQKQDGLFLDPACGSGTFLYFIIKEKRERLRDTQQTLEHILNSVFGVDIHPLAVIVAKTNYLLAIGDLLKKRKGKISIPIYLSDTIKLPEREERDLLNGVPFFKVKLDTIEIQIPEKLVKNSALYDRAIDIVKEFAIQNIGKDIIDLRFFDFIKNQYPELIKDSDIANALLEVSYILKNFIEKNRDTIWAFVLKNIYKPIFLINKFDFVIGNPPWLALRYAEPEYQKFLKEQITKNYNLLAARKELITHLELGTLFILRTAALYLKELGTIAFVLPRSIFNADQHDGLRQRIFKGVTLNYKEIWDLEKVEPLFNIPASVLIAQKQKEAEIYPITGKEISGKFDQRNAPLKDAEKILTEINVMYYIHKMGKHSFWATEKQVVKGKGSFYKKRFFQGAFIVPRTFWFVEVPEPGILGFNTEAPFLQTSKRLKPGPVDTYRDVKIEGNVDSKFLYYTLLGDDFLPFGYRGLRLIVLPIEPFKTRYNLLNYENAHNRGFYHLADWLKKIQAEWEKRRGAKAESMNIYERLNYYQTLTRQNPQAKYRVLYNTATTYLCACVIKKQHFKMTVSGQTINISGFCADTGTYYLETQNEEEAYYLSSILNAPIIDKLVKPMQTSGLFGVRNIHKKVLELPIHQFNSSDKTHLRLAELGKICSEKVAQWVQSGSLSNIKNIGILRSKVRETLKKELNEIDKLVEKSLGAL